MKLTESVLLSADNWYLLDEESVLSGNVSFCHSISAREGEGYTVIRTWIIILILTGSYFTFYVS